MNVKTKYLTLFAAALIFLSSCGQNKVPKTDVDINTPTQHETTTEKLDNTTYEILVTDHKPAVENFHVLFKTSKFDKASLQDFVDRFRLEFCNRQCNISIYDDKSIKSLVTKYPLPDKEYLKVADHFIANSTFDMTDVWLYPFQDIKYKELGGKNWKKEPIK